MKNRSSSVNNRQRHYQTAGQYFNLRISGIALKGPTVAARCVAVIVFKGHTDFPPELWGDLLDHH